MKKTILENMKEEFKIIRGESLTTWDNKELTEFLDFISKKIPAYELFLRAYRYLKEVHEGDIMILSDLLALGFNLVDIETKNVKGEDELISGVDHNDFSKSWLDKSVLITELYIDNEELFTYPNVRCKML